MRTGKGKKFTQIEEFQLESSQAREKKGLLGGDLERIPPERRGLKPFLKFDDFPVEIRRLTTSEEELADREKFLSHQPMEVEIGFGKGQFILHRANKYRDTHFLAFEIRRQLCLSLAKKIRRDRLHNLRIVYEDARVALEELIPDEWLSRCYVFFPDPWWKRRHVKKRILTPPFIELLSKKLQKGGILYIKTDVEPYAQYIEELLSRFPQLIPAEKPADLQEIMPTEREVFCRENGIKVYEFVMKKKEHIEKMVSGEL